MKTRLIRKRGGEGAREGTLLLAEEAPVALAASWRDTHTHAIATSSLLSYRARPLILGTWAENAQVFLRDLKGEIQGWQPGGAGGKRKRLQSGGPVGSWKETKWVAYQGRRPGQRRAAYLLNGTGPAEAEEEEGKDTPGSGPAVPLAVSPGQWGLQLQCLRGPTLRSLGCRQ